MISLLKTTNKPEIGKHLPKDYVVQPGDILGWPTYGYKLIMKNKNGTDWGAVCVTTNLRHINGSIGNSLETNGSCHKRTTYHGFEEVTEEERSQLTSLYPHMFDL